MAESSGSEKKTRQTERSSSTLSVDRQKARRGFLSGMLGAMGHLFFRSSNEDFEKRLQHLSKEEVAVHSRLKKRTQFWRKFARNLIVYSVVSEAVVLGVAIYSTRTTEMAWQTRALRVLPVFALPLFTTLLYSSCAKIHRMRERKDQRTLDRLRLERQEKIDELKERTNYYLTQQLIQKYDIDPAAKAAAARVLASKLGSESGLKFALQAAEEMENEQAGKSPRRSPRSGQGNEMDGGTTSGLKQRRNSQKQTRGQQAPFGQGNPIDRRMEYAERALHQSDLDGSEREQSMELPRRDMEYQQGKPSDGGWIARLAAMLVGEDPSQCYALLCGKCHRHNGLAKKEDFQYITYYCPRCGALNKSNHLERDPAEQTSQGSAAASPAAQDPAASSPGLRSGILEEEAISTSRGNLQPVQPAAPSETAITNSDLMQALPQDSSPGVEIEDNLKEDSS